MLVFVYVSYHTGWYLPAEKHEMIADFEYKSSSGVQERDLNKMVRHYRFAAWYGSSTAQERLALMYFEGFGVKENYKQAAKWWAKAADQGSASAQYNLANLYVQGKGVPKDKEKAKELYLAAAKQGHKEALAKFVFLDNEKELTTALHMIKAMHDKEEEERKEKIRNLKAGEIYTKLSNADEISAYDGISKVIAIEFTNNVTVNKINQLYLFLFEKTRRLPINSPFDPRFYLAHSRMIDLHLELVKEGVLKADDDFTEREKRFESVTQFFKWYLMTKEDMARCNSVKNMSEFLQAKQEGLTRHLTYVSDLPEDKKKEIFTRLDALSDLTARRDINKNICDLNPALENHGVLSDIEWSKKRAEVRDQIRTEYFSEEDSF